MFPARFFWGKSSFGIEGRLNFKKRKKKKIKNLVLTIIGQKCSKNFKIGFIRSEETPVFLLPYIFSIYIHRSNNLKL